MFWVISVYFNVRNILPKSGIFPPGHPVYIYIYTNNYLDFYFRKSNTPCEAVLQGGNILITPTVYVFYWVWILVGYRLFIEQICLMIRVQRASITVKTSIKVPYPLFISNHKIRAGKIFYEKSCVRYRLAKLSVYSIS